MSSLLAEAINPEGNRGLAALVSAGSLPESLRRSIITRTYEAGEVIHHSGERSEGVYIVNSGRIRLAQLVEVIQQLTRYPGGLSVQDLPVG